MDRPLNPSLGELARQAAELRRMIWRNFMPKRLSTSHTPSKTNEIDLSILRTSHQIYEEVSGEINLYKDETFEFVISPLFTWRKWITMRNSNQTEWHIEDQADAVAKGFLSLPYKKLQGVRVEIAAPDPKDQGQVICLWKKVRELVNLLEQVDLPPKFDIVLRNSGAKDWFLKGEPVQSIWEDSEISPHSSHYHRDYDVVLMPFVRLRNLSDCKIHTFQKLSTGLENFIRNIEHLMEGEQLFGQCQPSNPNDCWDDRNLKEDLDEVFFQFDRALDNLDGPTAAMLRLDRFSSWYTDGLLSESKYENELSELVSNLWWLELDSLFLMDYRYKMMRALNPLSAKEPVIPLLEYRYRIAPARCRFSDSENDGWDRDQWYQAYPEGIQPLNSSESRVEYLRKHNEALDRCWVPSLFDRLYPNTERNQQTDLDMPKPMNVYHNRQNCLLLCKLTDMKEDGSYILSSSVSRLPDDITLEEWSSMVPSKESDSDSCF